MARREAATKSRVHQPTGIAICSEAWKRIQIKSESGNVGAAQFFYVKNNTRWQWTSKACTSDLQLREESEKFLITRGRRQWLQADDDDDYEKLNTTTTTTRRRKLSWRMKCEMSWKGRLGALQVRSLKFMAVESELTRAGMPISVDAQQSYQSKLIVWKSSTL